MMGIEFFSFGGPIICILCLFNDSDGGQQIKKVIISLSAVGTIVILGAIFLAWYRWRANQKGKKMIMLYICCLASAISMSHAYAH